MREESNSITQLVKIVALEVIQQERQDAVQLEVAQQIRDLPHGLTITEIKSYISREATKHFDEVYAINRRYIKDVQTSLTRAGGPWRNDEDATLKNEWDMAIAQMAKNHGRTKGAIKCRLEHQGLTD